MALTKNQKIAVCSTALIALVTIWVTLYTHSPDLIHSEFEPPEYIPVNKMPNDFHLDIGNYGAKTGSYYLTLASDNASLNFGKGFSDDYQSELNFGYSLPPNDIDQWQLYVKHNDSCVSENISFVFSFTDKSGFIHRTERYTCYYDFDSESNKYTYKNMTRDGGLSIF